MGGKKIHPLIDQEKQRCAKKYRNDKWKLGIISYAVSAVFLLALLYLNISKNFVTLLHGLTGIRALIILLYFSTLYISYTLISFPFSYFKDFTIEHKYGFSTQNFISWLKDWIKSVLVTFIIGVIIFEVIYLITPLSPNLWWFLLSVIMILFNVILINLFPLLILPLFYKTSPIENETLKKRIVEICNHVKMNIKGIFSINLSSKTTKANAAVVGFGNTKRIVLGDTLLNEYAENEILSVLAHEITHYREYHIWWLIIWQSFVTLIMFYVLYRIHPFFYALFGFETISSIAAFPLFVLLFMIITFIFNPLSAAISRYYERRADRGALTIVNDPESFIGVMAKFCNKQLAIAYPHPVIEWYKYSHPSPGKRIKFAETWQAKQ